jgi:CO/xanthine dehydrogenase Mo-binding subunit
MSSKEPEKASGRSLDMHDENGCAVGRSVQSVDGPSKAKGSLRYVQDIQLPGMLYARMVLPQRPHAWIREINLKSICSVDGVVAVATGDDVPGENRVGVVVDDQPLFAARKVRYEADCIALVGAADPGSALRGASMTEIVFDDLPAVGTIDEALAQGAPSIHDNGNLAIRRSLTKGDIVRGEAESQHTVEETFETPVQEHAYLEPLGAVAVPDSDGGIELLAPGQCPFYIRDAVARCLGLALSKVRVVQLPIGGGFGGKEDVPSEICARLAVLAAKTGRPVKMVLTREEDIAYSSKRHPMKLRYRMGCDGEGRIKFADIEIKADVGAYATLSPIVLFRSTVHAAGPYEIPHVRVETRGFYTNTAPRGAMRGFGTPQVVFACEAMIDELAARVGMDPLAFRCMNALKPGGETATGQVLGESVGLSQTLKRVDQFLGARSGRFEARAVGKGVVRAKGVAAMFYGVSLGAIGRALDRGGAKVEVLKDGSVTVFIGCTDMGQGALTVLSQITADSLGVGIDRVMVNRVDTHIVPDSGPTVASRTTVVCGNAIIDACGKIKARMLDVAKSVVGEDAIYDLSGGGAVGGGSGKRIGFDELVDRCREQRVDLTATGWYAVPECRLDDTTGLGRAYHVYSFATDIAEVEVDLETGQVQVTSFWAVHDSGRIVNPLTAVSQVEGGVAQGLGLALCERFTQTGGRVSSGDFSTYLVPTSLDVCDKIRVEFVESLSPDGPFGAKGLGEPAIIPVPAAIANAVSNALGKRVTRLPVISDWIIAQQRNSNTA